MPDPIAVLRGSGPEIQTIDFDHSENVIYSGDSQGNVTAWSLDDYRPAAEAQRLHPLSIGVLNLATFHSTTTNNNNTQSTLVTQGRDSTTKIWLYNSDSKLPPSSSKNSQPDKIFSSPMYTFCRFSFLPLVAGRNQGTTGGSSSSIEDFVESCLKQGKTAEVISPRTNNREEPPPPPPSSSSSLLFQHHQHETPPCLIAIPDSNAQGLDVWCCGCGKKLHHLTVGGTRGMVMAAQLFIHHHPHDGCSSSSSSSNRTVCLIAGFEDGSLVVWNIEEGGVLKCQLKIYSEPITCICMDKEGRGGVCGSADKGMSAFILNGGGGGIEVKYTVDLKKGGGKGEGVVGLNDLTIRQDDAIFAAAGWDGKVRVYRYKNGKLLAVLRYHTAAVSAVEFGPKTGRLASASRDGTVALWDVYPIK